jgi:Right handed beta helix region
MKRILLSLLAILPILLVARPAEFPVSTVEQFLKAIGSNRTIILEKGNYLLSDFTETEGEHFSFQEHFNGKELVIEGVTNLTIKGSGNHESHLLTEPTYGNVLIFQDASGIRLENLKAGHGENKGECVGGVFSFKRSAGIAVENCMLYGSGTEGITAEDCKGLAVHNSAIYGCTYSICTLMACKKVSFTDCRLYENVEFDMVNVSNSKGVVFTDCKFSKNRAGDPSTDYSFFNLNASSVSLDHCTLLDNQAAKLCNEPKKLKVKACTAPKSQWGK